MLSIKETVHLSFKYIDTDAHIHTHTSSVVQYLSAD